MMRFVQIENIAYSRQEAGKPRRDQILTVEHLWSEDELEDEKALIRKNDAMFLRLKAYIKAQDQVETVLREIMQVLGPTDPNTLTIEALFNRLDGKGAQ